MAVVSTANHERCSSERMEQRVTAAFINHPMTEVQVGVQEFINRGVLVTTSAQHCYHGEQI